MPYFSRNCHGVLAPGNLLELLSHRRGNLCDEQLSETSVGVQFIKDRFLQCLHRLVRVLHHAADTAPTRVAAGRPHPAGHQTDHRRQEEIRQFMDILDELERDSENMPADPAYRAATNFICVRFADGSTRSGLIGSPIRFVVRPRREQGR